MLNGASTVVKVLLSGLLGYLLGATPTGVLVCRAVRGTDVRQHGSSHTGGLNVSRVAGIWAGAVTSIVDALLGTVAVIVATWLTENPWAATAAGIMAVVGHNWSVFIRFGGGIGLSTVAGALFGVSPQHTLAALVILVLCWLALVRLLRVHRARSTMLAMCVVGPLLWGLGMPASGVVLGLLGGVAVIIKTLPDWDRQY